MPYGAIEVLSAFRGRRGHGRGFHRRRHVHPAAHPLVAAVSLEIADDAADKEYEDDHHDLSETAAAFLAVVFAFHFFVSHL